MTGFGTATIDLDLIFWSGYSAFVVGFCVWFLVRHYYLDFNRAIKRELDYQFLDESILTKGEFEERKKSLREGLDEWLSQYKFQPRFPEQEQG